jgi:hypothetical protein
MNKILISIFFIAVVFMTTSCGNIKSTKTESNINTKFNTEYKKSRKTFYGELSEKESNEIRKIIENELNSKVPDGKSILINFSQKGSNCISTGLNNKDAATVINNGIQISSRISMNNNTIDFFVYTADVFHKDVHQTKANFKLDSGFFYNNIFTLHENCEAFFILKPNGQFMKFYGEDYFSEVENFLQK